MSKKDNPGYVAGWTEEQRKILREYYGKVPGRVIAKKIGRTLTSVQGQAHKLGLSAPRGSAEHKRRVGLVSKYYWKDPEYREKIKLALKKPKSEEFKSNVKTANIEHKMALLDEVRILKEQGFKVLNVDKVRPDIIARKNGKIYAVEVEFSEPDYGKYDSQNIFDDIIWIRKEHRYEKKG